MFRLLKHLTILALALVGAWGASADDKVLFEDDFEGDLSKWNAPPTWQVTDGRLLVHEGGIALCRTGDDWTDIVVEFDTTVVHRTAAWAYRALTPGDCMFMQLAGPTATYLPGYLRGHTFVGGRNQAVLEMPLPFAPAENRTYHVRVEMVGRTINTFIDGRWVHSDTAATFEKGTIGFRGAGLECAATFDNVVVRRLKALSPVPGLRVEKRTTPSDPYLHPTLEAKWIWGRGSGLECWFRQTFVLSGEALRARTVVTADNAFELYINGKNVARSDSWQHLHVLDAAAHLQPGRNVVAVHARNFEPGAAGLLFDCGIVTVDGDHVRISSDATWRVAAVGRPGWQKARHDDRSWPSARVLGDALTPPWDRVSRSWAVPYLGPCRRLRLVQADVPKYLVWGRDETQPLDASGQRGLSNVFLKFEVLEELLHNYPLVLRLRDRDGRSVKLMSCYGQEPTSGWEAGRRELTVPARPRWNPHLPAGRYTVVFEMPGAILVDNPDGSIGETVVKEATAASHDVPLENRTMVPGVFTDARGRTHLWGADSAGLRYDGKTLVPIRGTDGVFWCVRQDKNSPVVDALCDDEALADVVRNGLRREPVQCRLVDYIDCAAEPPGDVPDNTSPHEFSRDGGYGGRSRVLAIGGRSYRVTEARKSLSYYAYTVRCDSVGVPHVFCFETPNDIERYTMVRIQPPWDNVGCGVYTGREYPLDGRPVAANFMFYPRNENVRFTVSRTFSEESLRAESGAAVSRVWLLEVTDDVGSRRNPMHVRTDLPQRRFGISYTNPFHLYQLYGFNPENPFERRRSLLSFVDYARFVGMNYVEFNAVNGADVSVVAHYDSDYFDQSRDAGGAPCNLFSEFLPLAARAGIDVVPCLTSLSFKGARFADAPWISDETFQLDADGRTRREFFKHFGEHNKGTPDPLRPEVQKIFLGVISEMAARCRDYPAAKGIAFRVNGKIGTCYTGYSDRERAETAGYSAWNIAEFEKDTGIDVPDVEPTAYNWLRENAWTAWLDWRCERTRRLWLKARDIVRQTRGDWKLVVKCDLPSETPGRNILWPAGYDTLELLRTYGYDPRLYENERAILVQQGFFIGGGRYFHSKGPASPYYRNPDAWKQFDYQPGLWEHYANAAGYSCEFYHNYWEEFGVSPMGEFRTGFWGAGKMYPPGRHFLEPMTWALRTGNADTLVMFSWERGTQGHEAQLRRFVRAYRALPALDGEPFEGKVERPDGGTVGPRLWLRWFADRLAVLNDSPERLRLEVTIPAARVEGNCLFDYATHRMLWTGSARDEVTVELAMEAYDLRSLCFRNR